MIGNQVALAIPGGDQFPSRRVVDALAANEQNRSAMTFGERGEHAVIDFAPREIGASFDGGIIEGERDLRGLGRGKKRRKVTERSKRD